MRGARSYGPRDGQPEVSLKADWAQGVNTLLPDDRLPPLQFKHGMNVALRKGYPETRPGVDRANWLYSLEAAMGETFQGWGEIQGADPDPGTRLPLANLVVCDNDLWIACPNTEPFRLMVDVTDSTQEVEIIDCYNYALILRGLGQAPLRYLYEAGHLPEALPEPRDGQSALPNSTTGVYAGNRIWLKTGKNETVASDILEWDRDAVNARWTIDDGENDEILRYWKVGEDRIVVFKERSVHVIEGVSQLNTVGTDDAPQVQVRIYRVAAARGLIAKWAVDQRGQTLYYMSRDGLEALLLSDAGVTAMGDKPLSLAAKGYWDTLRWMAVSGAQMAIADQYLMISVPTRYREDEEIPSLTLGGAFTDDPNDDPETETVTMDLAFGWNVLAADGPELTNYVEFPFFQFIHWRADQDNANAAYGLRYRGIVRVWESGTVQMIGEMKFEDDPTVPTTLTELAYKLNFIETGQPGSLQTVATIPTDGDWHAVDWSGKPGALQHCETYYGGIPVSVAAEHTSVELFQYPDGLVLPADPPHIWAGSAGGIGITACGLVRDGNDIDFAWAIAPGAFTTQHYIATIQIDSTAADDTHGFEVVVGTSILHLNASTLGGSLGGTGTSPIPDSATVGLRIQIWTAHQNVNTGTFDCGPWFRTGYAPTVQQGIDPDP